MDSKEFPFQIKLIVEDFSVPKKHGLIKGRIFTPVRETRSGYVVVGDFCEIEILYSECEIVVDSVKGEK